MNLVLGRLMGINGLALATSLSAVYSCVLLYILLRKKVGDYGLKEMLMVVLKSAIGCVPMAATALFLYRQLWIRSIGVAGLFICVLLSCIVYFAVEFLIRNEPVISAVKKWTAKRK